MVQFQILDVYTQDFKIEYEDEFEKKGTFDFNDGLSESGSVEYIKKKIHSNDTNFKKEMIIHLFGMTSDGKSLRVSVNGFEPYFYVEIPNERALDILKNSLRDTLKRKKNNTLYDSISFTLEKKEKLYGYTNKTLFPFVKLSVRSKNEFYNLKKCFLNDKNQSIFKINGSLLKVYEANLDPMLRFFHLQNINPCGWVEIEDEYNETIDIHWLDIKPITSSIGTGVAPFCCAFWDIECYSSSGDFPVTKKNWSKIGKQLYEASETKDICIDLLCRAILNPKGKHQIDGIYLKGKVPSFERLKTILQPIDENLSKIFQKKENYSGDDITKILNTLKLSLDGDPIIQIGIVLTNGPIITDKYIFVFGSCSPIEGLTVKSYGTEKEMILGFVKFCHEKNPDMFIGYNIFGFDNKYLFERMQELGITDDESFQGLSRVIDIMDTESDIAAVELQEKFLSSSALGDNTLYLLTTTGRLHIDLYYYIKRIEMLSSYKLDDVCRHYMSGKLKSIDISNSTRWFINTSSTKDAELGKYVVLLDDIGDTIIEKRKIIEIIDGKSLVIEPCSKSYSISELESIVKWAIVKDDVSPAEIFRLHTLGPDERAIVAKYCIQDCLLVQQLYNKLDVFNNAMAMANTCSVPINYIFTRGQGIKCESLIFKECYQRNQLIEVLVNPDDTKPDESYEGAIVLVPEPNFYHESPIGVADFASLYPSTIISENISYDTLLWSKDYDIDYKFIKYSFGSLEDEKFLTSTVKFTDIEFDIWAPDPNDKRKQPEKLKTGIRICRYVQQANDVKGSLPDILTKLLTKRKERRKEAEKETDAFKKSLLDAEQLAYKLTANSLYGQLGSSTFKIRLQHLAASTTAYGRKQILFAKDAIERFYGKESKDPRCNAMTVYGDTDSLFINFNVTDPVTGKKLEGRKAIEATMELTEEAGKFVTRCLKKPHDFEYDKVFYPFLIFSKKRYVGNKYEDSSDNFKQTSMGIATKRRDYAAIVKNVYGGAIYILLNEKNPVKAFHFVQKTCDDLIEGKLSNHQITLSKSLRSEYKAVTPPAHKILAERIKARDPGNAPASGERLEFMYILPPLGTKSQGDRVETPSYIKEKGLKIDYKYYIEHQIYNPIVQLFSLFVEQLPGYTHTSKVLSDVEKERAAGDLLFGYIFNKCDKQTTLTNLGFKKIDNSDKHVSIKPVVQEAISSIKKKQTMVNMNTLTNMFLKQVSSNKENKKNTVSLEV
uniref:DNA-directed DNA polymerase n=1 Tax=viral metagenome TaxID=1070528 RepID=A0A6C0IFN7_9ZZZZ